MTRRGPLLTDRDREMLAWIGRHGLVTPEQVARRYFTRADGSVGLRVTYRRLQKLQELALLRRDLTPHASSPNVLRLTRQGARAAEIDVVPARLVESELRHALSLVELMEHLAADNPSAEIRTEREVRASRLKEHRLGARRPGRGRTPDGELGFPSGQTVAVELDLTPKRTLLLERILRAYRQERYDQVWWYVPPGVVPRLSRLVIEERSDDFVEVRPWGWSTPGAAQVHLPRHP